MNNKNDFEFLWLALKSIINKIYRINSSWLLSYTSWWIMLFRILV